MKEEIKKLRVEIDGLAQLTKQLNPFKWETFQRPEKEKTCIGATDKEEERVNIWEGNETFCAMVRKDQSMGAGYGGNFQQHALIRTDKGTFRVASNCFSLSEEDCNFQFAIDRNSVEINKAYDSLMLAKAWLGKILGEIGEETPYKNDGNRKSVEDIEPMADKAEILGTFGVAGLPDKTWKDVTHIERVDWLRGKVKILNDKIWVKLHENRVDSFSWNSKIAFEKIYEHLSEARFHLGFELQRIKEKPVNYRNGY